MRICLFFFLFITCFSCNNVTPGEKSLLEQITKTEKGLLRGAELGNNPQDIKALEETGLTEEHPDYLFYEFAIDSATSYTLSYSFESNELNEIRADIYIPSDTAARELSQEFIKYFSEKYDKPTESDSYFWAWPTIYNDTPMRIELSDESADYHHVGKLSLVIYKEPEMAM